ncbi:hypothetical protein D3C73_1627710 [compost metagenome]
MMAERVDRPTDSTALPRPSSRLPPTVMVKLSVVPSPSSVWPYWASICTPEKLSLRMKLATLAKASEP